MVQESRTDTSEREHIDTLCCEPSVPRSRFCTSHCGAEAVGSTSLLCVWETSGDCRCGSKGSGWVQEGVWGSERGVRARFRGCAVGEGWGSVWGDIGAVSIRGCDGGEGTDVFGGGAEPVTDDTRWR